VTMALVPNPRPDHYGGVRLDDDGRVTGFAPRGATAAGTFHFIGVQIAAAAAFDAVVPGSAANSVGDTYNRLIAERPGSVRGYVSNAGFWDIGTVEDYWRTSLEFAEGRDTLGRGRDVEVSWNARVDRSIVWDRARVGAGAELDECIVTDDVPVPAGAKYSRSILRTDPGHLGGVIVTPFDFEPTGD
jgi:NDP-sugar pyrophosphorylase family protein